MATPEKNVEVRHVPVESGLIVKGFDVKEDDEATIAHLIKVFEELPSKYHLHGLIYPVGTKQDMAIAQFTNAEVAKQLLINSEITKTELKFEQIEITSKSNSVCLIKIDPVFANVLSNLPSIQCEDDVKYYDDERCYVSESQESIQKVKENITTNLQRWLTDLKSSKVRPASSAASDSDGDGGSESSFVVLYREEQSSSTLNQTKRDVIACSVVVTVKENKECNINDEMSKSLKSFGSSTTSVMKEGAIVVFDDETDVERFIQTTNQNDPLIKCSKLQIPLVDRGEFVKFQEHFHGITKYFQQKWKENIVTLKENKFIICCKFEDILDDVSEEFQRQLKGKYKSIEPSQQVIERKPTSYTDEQTHTVSQTNQGNIDESQQKQAKVASKKTQKVDRSGYLTVHDGVYKFLVKFYEKELKEIEKNNKVNIIWLEDKSEQNLGIVSNRDGDEQNRFSGEAKFIGLYQKVHNSVQWQKISVEKKNQQDIKQALRNTRKAYKNILLLHDDNYVVFVGEESDVKQATKTFEQELGIHVERNKSEKSSDQLLSEIKVKKGIKLIIKQGDIILEDVDVIVNAANSELKHRGSVARAIAMKAGEGINKEGKQKLKELKGHQLGVGEVLHTGGYNLTAKYVIHAVGPRPEMHQTFQSLLERTFLNCLEYANSNLEASSISIPLISSGNLGGNKQQCAKALAVSLKEFVKVDKARCLKEIRLVNIDSEATQEILIQMNAVNWFTTIEIAEDSASKSHKSRINLANTVVVKGFREYESPGETKYQLAMILNKPEHGGGQIEHVIYPIEAMRNKAIVIFRERKVSRSLICNGTTLPGSKVKLQIRSIEVDHQKEAIILDASPILPICTEVLNKLPIRFQKLDDMKLLFLNNQTTTIKPETYVNDELEKWLNNHLKQEKKKFSLSNCVIVTQFEKTTFHESTSDKMEANLQKQIYGGGDVAKIVYPFGVSEEKALAVFYESEVASSLTKAKKMATKTGKTLMISPFKVRHPEEAFVLEFGEVAHLLDPTLKTNILKSVGVRGAYLDDGKQLLLYDKGDTDKIVEHVTAQLEWSLTSYVDSTTTTTITSSDIGVKEMAGKSNKVDILSDSEVNLQITEVNILDVSPILPICTEILNKLPIRYYKLRDMKLLFLENHNTTKNPETYVNDELEKWLNNQLKQHVEKYFSLSHCVIVTNFEKSESHVTTSDKIHLALQKRRLGGGEIAKIMYPFGKCEDKALAVFYEKEVASSLIKAKKITNKRGQTFSISPFKVGHSEEAFVLELGEVEHLLDPILKSNIFKTLRINGEYLDDGKLVLYNKADGDKIIKYVTDQLGKGSSASSSGPRGIDQIHPSEVKFALPGGITVTVRQGDITEENVDVIVNDANAQLQHGSGVARAIADKAGRQLHEEGQKKLKRRKRYLNVTEVLHTDGYNLKARYVIHAVGPCRNEYKNEDEFVHCLEKTFHNCLKYAFDIEVMSIAIPLISSGIFGGNKAECAQSLLNSILLFAKNDKHHARILKEIHLVNIDVEATSEIQDVFNKWQQSGKKTASQVQAGMDTQPNDVASRFRHHHNRSTSETEDPSYEEQNKVNSKQEKDEVEECPICLEALTEPVKLQCGHKFDRDCIDKALQFKKLCPICGIILGVMKGNQPPGKMTITYSSISLPGYSRCGSIVISYDIPSGIQTKDHPNPGQRYNGTSRNAYLPDNQEGRHVSGLLQKAFNAWLIFTIGTSITSGTSNAVIWNDIHHKTTVSGQPYGYPDPTYLSRVREELAAKGIK